MKKTFTILTILALVLVAMLGSSVNAATFEASEDTVVGGSVSVTIRIPASGSLDSRVHYNTDLLTYTGCEFDNADNLNADAIDKGEGLIIVSAFAKGDGTATFTYATLNFTAKAAGVAKFTIEEGSFDTNTHDEELENYEVSVNITEPTGEGDTPPSDEPGTTEPETPPTDDPTPTEPETPSTSGNGPVGTDGNTITELPDTGTPVYMVAGIVIAIAVVALVVKKIRK